MNNVMVPEKTENSVNVCDNNLSNPKMILIQSHFLVPEPF